MEIPHSTWSLRVRGAQATASSGPLLVGPDMLSLFMLGIQPGAEENFVITTRAIQFRVEEVILLALKCDCKDVDTCKHGGAF